jgi:hypothetical protein
VDAAVRRSGESVVWAERRERKAAEARYNYRVFAILKATVADRLY